MPRATIMKRFDFHAAHVLPHHDGKCVRLHGHTYTVDVAVAGWVKDPSGEPDEGMVKDFDVLKRVYKSHIEPLVEHQFLNHTLVNDLPKVEVNFSYINSMLGLGVLEDDDRKVLWALTTAENLAAWMHRQFSGALMTDHVCITVWETPTSSARVGGTN